MQCCQVIANAKPLRIGNFDDEPLTFSSEMPASKAITDQMGSRTT